MKYMNRKHPHLKPLPKAKGMKRRGTTAFEIIVSFTLLSSVLAFATPLVVRHTRLLAAQRHYRLALDELSNQLERLSALPADELPAAVEQLAASDFVAERLPGAELRGQLEAADIGQRLTLRLTWDEPQRREAPLRLTAWIMPETEPATSPPDRR
jgi:hypothetical protein